MAPLATRPAASISGVGVTEFSTDSGVSEAVLVRDAVLGALDDAGLELSDVDGYVTYSLDSNDPVVAAQLLGFGPLSWFSITAYGGGGACAAIQDAALAVSNGLAEVVLVVRAANMRSGFRYGKGGTAEQFANGTKYSMPWGNIVPGHMGSLWFHRYMHEYGLTNIDLAQVVVSARDFASTNPRARFFERPLTTEEHQASPWVAEPVLRRNDCCLETDGGVAFVVTSAERARDLKAPPVDITASARGMASRSMGLQQYYGDATTKLPDLDVVAEQLWRQSGLTPADISTAIFYDAFSPLVLLCLESFGFCGRGEAGALVADGYIGRNGTLPVNPNGGQLGEGYLQGFNGIAEAVLQLRGRAVNQVAEVEHVIATGGPALPTSGLILSRRA